ncbi:2-phospho-L-lactate guanylyltransferase [Phenylobacterium sp. SCN 70-31]|uniref:2-phospho-L-lactate guanylyltransferase n=1 Tax=Phenylobacterium sp. SCN 70-31 TaxID=1660129 RepID=UPI00086DCAC4|nr:2-phospho-L-lactate guanylyltransferase [Phenylobacterium sp. SCN 70-31]ODT88304.1 MAG: 2-phospho-L-lactate guanylyltransferase [Phenylobacterium sp. SCN 70-31]
MNAHVVIAVRGGTAAKSRCADRLNGRDREGLVQAMLVDMLQALSRCSSVRTLHVVTQSPDIACTAERAGASAILEPAPSDLNGAFEMARARLTARHGNELIAFLPGDLPLAAAHDVERLLALASGEPKIVLAPADLDGGTAAVVHPADLPFPLAFGPNSFQRHQAAAHAGGFNLHVTHAGSLGFDVDHPGDLDLVVASAPHGCTATVARSLLAPRKPSHD